MYTHLQMQDEFLKRLAEDTVLYVRTVCNTIIMEVPKAIVHCQVGPDGRLHSASALPCCPASRTHIHVVCVLMSLQATVKVCGENECAVSHSVCCRL